MQTTEAATQVRHAFEAGLIDWRTRLNADEWHFARLRDNVVHPLSPADAFANIGAVVELVLCQRDPDVRVEVACLLLDLVRQANTTQLHPVLEKEWSSLAACVLSSQAEELKRWYRKASA